MTALLETYPLKPSDHLIVGCSGGPDSMYLLEQLRAQYKNPLVVAHVEHTGFRDGAQKDAQFVRAYCEKYALIFEHMQIEISEIKGRYKTSSENASRIERKKFFEALQQKHQARYILLAHHLDDQIETMIYRIARGTKLQGLTGMHEQQWDYIRPLLSMPKSEILDWLHANTIEYMHDPSNLDDGYMRNHIRQNILPHFETINPNYRENIQQLRLYFTQMHSWIESMFAEIVHAGELEKDYYLSLPPFLQTECIRSIYNHCNQGTIGLSESNIQEVHRYILGEHGNKKKKIQNMDLYKKGGIIYF